MYCTPRGPLREALSMTDLRRRWSLKRDLLEASWEMWLVCSLPQKMWLVSFYMEWNNELGQATAELPVWKAAIPSGGDWVGFVPASFGYPAVIFYTVARRKRRGRSCKKVEGVVGCDPENLKRILAFSMCVLWEVNVTGQPSCRSGPHSYRISLVSIKREDMHINGHENV